MKTKTLAQTHTQGPVNGSGKPLTKDDLAAVKQELEEIKAKYGLKEPSRSFMDEPDTDWRFGGPPDYSLTNLYYLMQRSKEHPEDSLEKVVENLVKTWEMERSHKVDCKQHKSVDQERFLISANGGKKYDNVEANQVGNYNVLLDSCPAEIWDKSNISWENSHDMFHDAFAAFPWEILEVYSGPPKVGFSWRHWGHFTGTYEENKGKGELIEVFGFGTAVVNENLQLCDVEIYYNAEDFIRNLRGEKKVEDTNTSWNAGATCPFAKALKIVAEEGEEKKEDEGKSKSCGLLCFK